MRRSGRGSNTIWRKSSSRNSAAQTSAVWRFYGLDHDVRLDEALTIAAQENASRKDIFTADIYAWTLYKKGKFQEAKAAIKEAMRLKTKDARTFYHAGMIEKALGNEKEAKRFLQSALQINPAFDILQAEQARAALAELK